MSKVIPTVSKPSNSHVNILRYVRGVDPKYRSKQMSKQLSSLLAVNDCNTLPNGSNKPRGLFSSFVK